MRVQENLSSSLLLFPLLTIATPLSTTTTQDSQSQPTPTPSASPALDPSSYLSIATILPSKDTDDKLDLRAIVPGQPAAVPTGLPAIPTQVSPVTTLFIWQTVAPGAPAQQVQVVYSQAFVDVPDQWEGPIVGSIGLGTIKGEVGAVKTKDGKAKRDADAMPTGVAVPEKRDLEAREPFVILPPGNPGVQEENRLVKRQRRKGSSGGNGNGTEEEEEENAATTTRMGMTLGAPALALLVAVLGAVIM